MTFPLYKIGLGLFGRWVIYHPVVEDFAWSGSRWVLTIDGFPSGGIQICNFETREEAESYCEKHGVNGYG